MSQDEEHLRLLSIFHYVIGGIVAVFALFPSIHLCLGLLFILAPDKLQGKGPPPPAFVGWFFVIVASIMIAFGMTLAGLALTTGRFLAKRRHHTFCLVVAGLECLFMPLGTALGVFTIIVLSRVSVKQLFETHAMPV